VVRRSPLLMLGDVTVEPPPGAFLQATKRGEQAIARNASPSLRPGRHRACRHVPPARSLSLGRPSRLALLPPLGRAARKAPGGGSTVTSPSMSSGERRTTTGSALGPVAPAQPREIGALGKAKPAPAGDRSRDRAACAGGSARRGAVVSFTTASAAAPSGRTSAKRRPQRHEQPLIAPGDTQVPTSTTRALAPRGSLPRPAALGVAARSRRAPFAGRAHIGGSKVRVDAALAQCRV